MQTLDDIAPAVTIGDFKRAVHLDDVNSSDDLLVTDLIAAAQEVVETACARPLSPRLIRFTVPNIGWRRWWFPVAPVSAVTAISYADDEGAEIDLDPADLLLQRAWDEPQILAPSGFMSAVPSGADVLITAMCGGFGLPQSGRMRRAIILTVKEWYEAQISPEKVEVSPLTFAATNIIRQVRYRRPRQWRDC